MERRRDKRWPRRLSIRFWRQGETKASPGYSTNISRSGIFIRTVKPYPSGTRLRIEIFEAQSGFMIEGEVARSIQVPAHLQAVRQPGMGVRFLTVDSLLKDLLPDMARADLADTDGGTQSEAEIGGTSSEPPIQQPKKTAQVPAYRVTFKTRNQYMAVFQRDLINGGLFVATTKPAPVDSDIEIEIKVSDSGQEAIRLAAMVVHRVDPNMEGLEDANLLAGMGVEFSDPKDAVKRLTNLATSLF